MDYKVTVSERSYYEHDADLPRQEVVYMCQMSVAKIPPSRLSNAGNRWTCKLQPRCCGSMCPTKKGCDTEYLRDGWTSLAKTCKEKLGTRNCTCTSVGDADKPTPISVMTTTKTDAERRSRHERGQKIRSWLQRRPWRGLFLD